MTEKWFAVMCKPQREAYAALRLGEQKIKVFYPHYPANAWRERDRFRSELRKRPYLQGYLFVRSALDHLSPVYHTSGVLTVVGIGAAPLAIPDEIIDGIRELTRTDKGHEGEIIDHFQRQEFGGKAGDRARFKEGSSLWGFYCEIKSVCPNHLVVKLENALAGRREIEVGKDDIEIIRDEGKASA